MSEAVKPRLREIDYPSSDGKPMAETDLHRDIAVYVIEALKTHFSGRPDVYVSGNNFIYYEEGNPKARVSPDAYVVFDVGMHPRDSYFVWREGGRVPDVVFEFTSRKTRKEDTDLQRPLYEQALKVTEYFLFDPRGDYLKPRFQGFRLVEGSYVPLEVVDGRLRSQCLNLDLVPEGPLLRLVDPDTGEALLSPLEQHQARRTAEAEARRAEAETRLAEAEARRAEAVARRVEEENARLRAELEALRRQRPGQE